MLPLLVKSKSAEHKAQKNIRFQVVTELAGVPGWMDGTWTQGMGRFWVVRAEMEVRRRESD